MHIRNSGVCESGGAPRIGLTMGGGGGGASSLEDSERSMIA